MAIQFCGNTFNVEPLIMDLQEIIDKSNELLASGDTKTWKDYSEAFHVAFYRHAGNAFLEEADAKLRAKLELLSCMYYQDQNVKRINDGHIAIFRLVQEGKFKDAANAMRKHLHYDMALALKAYKAYFQSKE